jgi:hypothetical protein
LHLLHPPGLSSFSSAIRCVFEAVARAKKNMKSYFVKPQLMSSFSHSHWGKKQMVNSALVWEDVSGFYFVTNCYNLAV